MGRKNRHTFAKRQREIKRMQKAQEKREKRLAKKEDELDPDLEPGDDTEAVDGEITAPGPEDEPQVEAT